MDLQEKLNETQNEILRESTIISISKNKLKDLKKKEKGYLKLIEGAKSLEQK